MADFLEGFLRDERGAETVEYALVLGLMALAAVVGVTAAGDSLSKWWNGVSTSMNAISTG